MYTGLTLKRTHQNIVIKMAIEIKIENIKKVSREQQHLHTGELKRLSAESSAETLSQKEWHNIFKVMKGKNLQPRIFTQQGSCLDLM